MRIKDKEKLLYFILFINSKIIFIQLNIKAIDNINFQLKYNFQYMIHKFGY